MKRRLLVMIPALAGLVVIVPVKVFASSGRQMGPGGRMRPGGQAATMTRTMATPTRTPGMERHATATPRRGGYTMMPSMGRRASMQAMGPGAAMPGMHGLPGMGPGGQMDHDRQVRAGGRMDHDRQVGAGGQMGPGHMRLGLDWACPYDCADKASTCSLAAQESQRLCVQATCGQQANDVRDACDADASSQSCNAAQQAQIQCLRSCIQVSAMRECSQEQYACRQSCPLPGDLFSKDPQCVGDCESTYTGCLNTAESTAQTCRLPCDKLVVAAQEACEAGRTTDACQTALQDARACLEPCGDDLQLARRTCIDAAQDCVAACSDVAPAP